MEGSAVTIICLFHSAVTNVSDFPANSTDLSAGQSSGGAGVLRRVRMPKTASSPPIGRRSYERKGETPKEAAERRRPEGSNPTDETVPHLQASQMMPCLLCLGSCRTKLVMS